MVIARSCVFWPPKKKVKKNDHINPHEHRYEDPSGAMGKVVRVTGAFSTIWSFPFCTAEGWMETSKSQPFLGAEITVVMMLGMGNLWKYQDQLPG